MICTLLPWIVGWVFAAYIVYFVALFWVYFQLNHDGISVPFMLRSMPKYAIRNYHQKCKEIGVEPRDHAIRILKPLAINLALAVVGIPVIVILGLAGGPC